MRRALSAAGIYAKVIYSAKRFLDIIPGKTGERCAVEYILHRWALSGSTVLACGDSGNDLDLIKNPRFLGIIVGNADDDILDDIARRKNTYKSTLPHAAGVLEGSFARGFWLS